MYFCGHLDLFDNFGIEWIISEGLSLATGNRWCRYIGDSNRKVHYPSSSINIRYKKHQYEQIDPQINKKHKSKCSRNKFKHSFWISIKSR